MGATATTCRARLLAKAVKARPEKTKYSLGNSHGGAPAIPFRELRDFNDGWSSWAKIMRHDHARGYARRNGKEQGYYKREWTIPWPEGEPLPVDRCGVYEFKIAVSEQGRTRHKVVYVGCTCRQACGDSLKQRIEEYMKHGSHKTQQINAALGRRAKIYVRVMPCATPIDKSQSSLDAVRREALRMESQLLNTYDYAWNEVQNGKMRAI